MELLQTRNTRSMEVKILKGDLRNENKQKAIFIEFLLPLLSVYDTVFITPEQNQEAAGLFSCPAMPSGSTATWTTDD